MKIEKFDGKIVIHNPQDFNVEQTLNCGQIFRYSIDGNRAIAYSKDKKAELITATDKITILTDNVEYFYNFFDFATDYALIKNKLRKDSMLKHAVDYGYGIRILNNDAFEMLVSFIISANNNIPRIKKSVEYLCKHFGENKGDYFAFPTLKELKKATEKDYVLAGLGYRAKQMYETIQKLTDADMFNLKNQSKEQQFKTLLSLKGVGEKVANCVMLFGLHCKDVFPVDTWINKVYNDLMGKQETDRRKITKDLTKRYGNLSGYAQQYFFYYYRENK